MEERRALPRRVPGGDQGTRPEREREWREPNAPFPGGAQISEGVVT